MALKLSKVRLEDFDAMITHATKYSIGDDLVGPPTPLCWPITTQPEAHSRLDFHMSAQRRRFLGDRTATYLKIVETETGEIVSIARWHKYPRGYSYADGIGWEIHSPVEGVAFPEGMNVALHNYILSTRDAEREKWMAKGEPCWVLMHLVTRISQRGRGAAGLLIGWGVEKAREEGVPAYLEAGIAAKPLYEKLGFEQVGELMVVDMRAHGVEMDFVMAKMQIKPQKQDASERED